MKLVIACDDHCGTQALLHVFIEVEPQGVKLLRRGSWTYLDFWVERV